MVTICHDLEWNDVPVLSISLSRRVILGNQADITWPMLHGRKSLNQNLNKNCPTHPTLVLQLCLTSDLYCEGFTIKFQ